MKLFKKRENAAEAADASVAQVKAGGKGRATPKRKDAQARGLRPVVPSDRKAAKQEERALRDQAWDRQRNAMATGDDRYLPARDKGPVKRYIREYIDARFSLGELFLPLSVVMIVLVMVLSRQQSAVSFYALMSLYLVLFASLIDAGLCWWLLRSRLYKKFGKEEVRSKGMIFWYVFGRCFNLRRWRQPAPQNRRGDYPS